MYEKEKILEIIYEIYDETKDFGPYVIIAQPRRDSKEIPAQEFNVRGDKDVNFEGYSSGYIDISGQLVDVARNYLMEVAMDSNAKYLFFIGEDTVVPIDGFMKLHEIAEKNPDSVVTGVYYYKAGGPMIVVQDGLTLKTPNCDPGQIIEAYLTGMDCMLIPLDILRKMKKEEPETPFCCVYNDPKLDLFVGEDNFFTYRLRKSGYRLLVSTDVQCLHMDLASGKYTAHPSVNLDNYKTRIPITEPLTIADKVYLEKRWLDRLPKPNYLKTEFSKEIVISAFNRDYEWISNLNPDIKKTIYRKGVKIENNKEQEIFIENNVGRDVHTFFYHLYHNYDNLSDYTFFAQDYPFDHWSNLVETVNGDKETIMKNAMLTHEGYFAYLSGPDFNLDESVKVGNGKVLICNPDGSPHHPGLDLNYCWNLLFYEPSPDKYEFVPAGHFGITKEHARKRSKEFYGEIVKLLETYEQAPWIIERLEGYIFNTNFKTKL